MILNPKSPPAGGDLGANGKKTYEEPQYFLVKRIEDYLNIQ
jgi:hypothetical protein